MVCKDTNLQSSCGCCCEGCALQREAVLFLMNVTMRQAETKNWRRRAGHPKNPDAKIVAGLASCPSPPIRHRETASSASGCHPPRDPTTIRQPVSPVVSLWNACLPGRPIVWPACGVLRDQCWGQSWCSQLPKLTSLVNLLWGPLPTRGKGPLLVKEWAILATLSCTFEKVVANTFGTRGSRLVGAL